MLTRNALKLSFFFSSAQYFLVLFLFAPFLATHVSEAVTGFILSAGAFLTLAVFPFVPALVRRVGSRRLLIAVGGVSAAALIGLAALQNDAAILALAVVYMAAQPIIAYFFDLLIEASVEGESETGRVRAVFLTCSSAALVLAPISVGLLLGSGNEYGLVFSVAAVLFIPLILTLVFSRISEGDPPHFAHILDVAQCLYKDTDVRAVGIAMIVLQFFYQLAPIFIPLYLHTVIGIPWSELGWIFTIMLLPFLLLPYPVGWLADRVWGDQELMALGFLIMGTALAAIAFVSALTPLVIIAIVLFISRVGAATAEATIESHFFRRVSERDANSVGVFRMMRPVGALMAPLFGSLVLITASYPVLFFVAGIGTIIFGVGSALSTQDVR